VNSRSVERWSSTTTPARPADHRSRRPFLRLRVWHSQQLTNQELIHSHWQRTYQISNYFVGSYDDVDAASILLGDRIETAPVRAGNHVNGVSV
jgi:hypothetical protein